MKTKTLLSCFVAMFVAVLAMSVVAAGTLDIASMTVSANDVEGSIVASPGEAVDVDVRFVSNEDITDAKVTAWISGYKDDIEASTSRFDVIADKNYRRMLTLNMPSIQDIEDVDEDLTLHVKIEDKNDDFEAQEYTVTLEKDSYAYNLLSVDAPSKASAGEIVVIDVVLKNTGRQNLDDTFVVAKIAELGISKKVYMGDIAPSDNFNDDDDAEDAVEKRIYLTIPSDAKSGEYEVEVKAYNYDADARTTETITIQGTSSEDGKAVAIDTGKDTSKGISNSMLILTVALVIVFLVLLVVLIVLLTKKPEEKVEDFGETSYY